MKYSDVKIETLGSWSPSHHPSPSTSCCEHDRVIIEQQKPQDSFALEFQSQTEHPKTSSNIGPKLKRIVWRDRLSGPPGAYRSKGAKRYTIQILLSQLRLTNIYQHSAIPFSSVIRKPAEDIRVIHDRTDPTVTVELMRGESF